MFAPLIPKAAHWEFAETVIEQVMVSDDRVEEAMAYHSVVFTLVEDPAVMVFLDCHEREEVSLGFLHADVAGLSRHVKMMTSGALVVERVKVHELADAILHLPEPSVARVPAPPGLDFTEVLFVKLRAPCESVTLLTV